ncbi:winged helix-turn-helix transcriptional regulator [Candidatus Acetothermia bacterium]|nr:winged helix-turn-helix transcriptional regulator [Candidatus Acetothermia bacterium]
MRREVQLTELDQAILETLRYEALKPQALKERLNVNYSTLRKRLARLRSEGLLTQQDRWGPYKITPAGEARLAEVSLPRLSPMLTDPGLQGLIESLPSGGHRALFRLALSGVVAKKHLWKSFTMGWAYFCIAGKTKRFKSALGAVLCQVLYGTEADFHLYSLQSASEHELLGRRHVQKGGEVKLAQSPIWKVDFIVLDELDKCRDEAVRRMVLFFCDGRSRFPVEGELVENHVTPFITLNHVGDLKEKLGEPYLRRGIVLNIDSYEDELDGIELRAHEIFAKAEKVRLGLERLSVERAGITKEDRAFLHHLAHDHLNEEGKSLSDTHTLEILVLGRLALLGPKAEVREAIFETLQDYLICAETVGFTQEGWGSRFMEKWIEYRGQEDPALRQRYDEHRQRREARERQQQEREAQQVEKKIAATRARANFIENRSKWVTVLTWGREELRTCLQEEWGKAGLSAKSEKTRVKKKWNLATKPLQDTIGFWIEKVKATQDQRELTALESELNGVVQEIRQSLKSCQREVEAMAQVKEAEQLKAQALQAQVQQREREIKELRRRRTTLVPYLQKTRAEPNIATRLEQLGLIKKIPYILRGRTLLGFWMEMPDEKYVGVDGKDYRLHHFESWADANSVIQTAVTELDQKIANLESGAQGSGSGLEAVGPRRLLPDKQETKVLQPGVPAEITEEEFEQLCAKGDLTDEEFQLYKQGFRKFRGLSL